MNYLAFIAAYPILFWFLVFIPIPFYYEVIILVSFIAMVIVFVIINWKYEGFNNQSSYIIHLVAISILALVTIVHERFFEVTIIKEGGIITSVHDYTFYQNTLGLNHSMILATLLFLGYAFLKRNWRNVLLSLTHIIVFLFYLFIVV
jgi:hypothetical protein